MREKIWIISAALPPQLDGIGDYTARIAAEISGKYAVTVLTNHGHPVARISGVEIDQSFSIARPRTLSRVVTSVKQNEPNWVLLQYNPFSFGRWGFNLHLPLVMRAIGRSGKTKVALMVHEPFVPLSTWKFAIMSVWQRWQLWMLGTCADVLFFSIEPWVYRFQKWFPSKPLVHLPVGSNILRISLDRAGARARLNIKDNATVLGLFGTLQASRMIECIRGAAEAAGAQPPPMQLLYIGPNAEAAKAFFPNTPLLAEGPLDEDEVSRRFAAMDIYLAPYIDGISTRRTTLMTGLQHGVATVGTRGFLTDNMLLEEAGAAFLLADVDRPDEFNRCVLRLISDAALRAKIGAQGQRLYHEHFHWDRIAAKLTAALTGSA